MTGIPGMDCGDVAEQAAPYVIGALSAAEAEAVRDHLRTCDRPHPEFAELGGVVAYLAELAEPVDAPETLKARVLAAVAADAERTVGAPVDLAAYREQRRFSGWRTWALAAAAVVVIAALGAWNLTLQSRTSESETRLAVLRDAIIASAAPDARTARLSGAGAAEGATGFVALPAEGTGYAVLTGLAPAPRGFTYQGWYLDDGQPFSVGLVDVGPDGLAILEGVEVPAGADAIAFTVEVAGGVPAPSSDPVILGEITEDAAPA